MGYSIHQIDASTWELRDGEKSIGTFEDGIGRTGYDLAVGVLAGMATAADGLLPEGWRSENGIAFSRKLAGGRDFTNTVWSWRDPATTLVPLMLQTSSEAGHQGAELSGFVTEMWMNDGSTPDARGRFYDTPAGRQHRDLLTSGERYGVSVDPSEAIDMEICEDFDGEMSAVFHAYEIAGMTGTPFPGFEEAQLVLDPNPGEAVPVRAAMSIPTAPPRAWMTLAEPVPGVPFLDGDGADVLFEQTDKYGDVVAMAVPLTIRDDGLVYGHATWWGQCHIGDPWGSGKCASAQPSRNGYKDFLAGEVVCDDGTRIPTGRLTVGCEHSQEMTAADVRDHLAHAGMGWANVNVTDGEFGVWVCGVLDPNLTDKQIALLRSLAMSGEWIEELGGILSVNAPGLPIQRQRIAASGFPTQGFTIPQPALRASVSGGTVKRLVGANIVQRCVDCEKRRLAASAPDPVLLAIADLAASVRAIDLRTRHLAEPAAEAMLARLAASAKNGQT